LETPLRIWVWSAWSRSNSKITLLIGSKSRARLRISGSCLATISLATTHPLPSMETTKESRTGESVMAAASHAPIQSLHREHSRIFVAFALPSSMTRILRGHTSTHFPHPSQASLMPSSADSCSRTTFQPATWYDLCPRVL